VELTDGASRIVRECAGIGAGERITIVLEDGCDAEVAAALAVASRAAGASPEIIRADGASLGPDTRAGNLASWDHRSADVLFGVTSRSLYHSMLGRQASEDGARVLALTGVSAPLLTSGGIEADFAAIAPRCVAVGERLTAAKRLEVTSPSGLSLSADISGRSGYANTSLARHPGDRTGCLDIEAFIAPVEGSATGTLVADASTTLFGLVDEPVRILVRDGVAVQCEGGATAAAITDLLGRHGPEMRMIAEFGFGLNPKATVVGAIVQDEATYGTGHVALGSNESFGGLNRAPLHFDLVYWRPTVYLDDELFMRDGQLADEAPRPAAAG
jgi:leucyl aminopeptidase (aminopeptidase T)